MLEVSELSSMKNDENSNDLKVAKRSLSISFFVGRSHRQTVFFKLRDLNSRQKSSTFTKISATFSVKIRVIVIDIFY